MFYDTLYRHNQALAAGPAAPVGIALHALTAAIEDCRRAGKPPERDAAVLLLMRALGDSAARAEPDLEAVRTRCAADRAAILASPALLALAGRSLGDDPHAKRTFHAQARRALLRLAEGLGLAAPDIRILPGADHEDGVTELRHADLLVRVGPRGFLPDQEIAALRCVSAEPVGRGLHAPIALLLDPAALRRRIETAFGTAAHPMAAAA